MKFKFEAMRRFGDVFDSVVADIEADNVKAVDTAGRFALRSVREQTEPVLGRKVSNAWRLEFFPRGCPKRAAYVFTRAPDIIRAYADGATIRGKKGNYLAIPTANAPLARGARGGGKRMTIDEARAFFNAPPRIIPAKRPGVFVVVFQAVRAKTKKGFRRATRGRLQQGRNVIDVPMFILVRQVTVQKRLDLQRVTREAGEVLLRELKD